jgi:hypothetical protein
MSSVSLTPGKRVLFLTNDPELVRAQLRGELNLRMRDLRVEDLMDDVNTDAMTPAWVCFDYRPEDIARNAYAGITIAGERLFAEGALADGDFEVIVSGFRKGVGSSRETAVQAENPEAALGLDLKYGLTTGLTFTGTVNPDFGQVEADPARPQLLLTEPGVGYRLRD